MLDVLAGHADIVGDLVDLMALFSPGQDAGAAKAVNGGMVGIVGVNVPIVFLDLAGNPFLAAAADGAAFRGVGEPSRPARADRRGCIARSSANRGAGRRGIARWVSASGSW